MHYWIINGLVNKANHIQIGFSSIVYNILKQQMDQMPFSMQIGQCYVDLPIFHSHYTKKKTVEIYREL